jgi:hypothetical protein
LQSKVSPASFFGNDRIIEADFFSGKNVPVGIECQIATTASLWAGITFCKPKVAIKVRISTTGVRPFVQIDTNDNTQPLSLSLGAWLLVLLGEVLLRV